jgi:hypothetical protein
MHIRVSLFQEQKKIDDPFEIAEPFVEVHADHQSERIAAQRGLFTLHKVPDQPFREKTLVTFIFPEKRRNEVLNEVDFYGVNESSLFPGLAVSLVIGHGFTSFHRSWK